MEGLYSSYPVLLKNHGMYDLAAEPLINIKMKHTKVSGLIYCGYTMPLELVKCVYMYYILHTLILIDHQEVYSKYI